MLLSAPKKTENEHGNAGAKMTSGCSIRTPSQSSANWKLRNASRLKPEVRPISIQSRHAKISSNRNGTAEQDSQYHAVQQPSIFSKQRTSKTRDPTPLADKRSKQADNAEHMPNSEDTVSGDQNLP